MVQRLIGKLIHHSRRAANLLDVQQTVSKIAFLKEYRAFKKLMDQGQPRFDLKWEDRLVFLNDKTPSTGFDRHYIYHPAWAARILARTNPASHVDLSSSLYFCSMLSAFVPVRFYDYRPAELDLSNLTSEAADLLALPFADRSINSLSCMHVVEHVGLGRYGDPLDPDGDLKAIAELKRVLAPGGSLLFVVPVGQPKIMFNGHRIYSYDQIINYFAGLELKEFALIPDDPVEGGLICHATKEQSDKQSYGCGCFWFGR
jgi:SAM-dependent methyltransferase